jgi:hypothetical protein
MGKWAGRHNAPGFSFGGMNMDPMTEDEVADILRHKRLRDEMAMAALPAIYARADKAFSYEQVAEAAYIMADAMMVERDR